MDVFFNSALSRIDITNPRKSFIFRHFRGFHMVWVRGFELFSKRHPKNLKNPKIPENKGFSQSEQTTDNRNKPELWSELWSKLWSDFRPFRAGECCLQSHIRHDLCNHFTQLFSKGIYLLHAVLLYSFQCVLGYKFPILFCI